jgi:hypothetical protein
MAQGGAAGGFSIEPSFATAVLVFLGPFSALLTFIFSASFHCLRTFRADHLLIVPEQIDVPHHRRLAVS